MDITNKTNFTCDTETGICEPGPSAVQEDNSALEPKIKSKLTYYYDALCGWCYGFGPVITEIHKVYKHKVDFELISGGLFLGSRTGYINDVAPYIKAGAYKSVESTTGVKFGTEFLTKLFGDGKILMNSLTPSIALCIVKEKYPERQLEFGEFLLNAIYSDGLSPDDTNGLAGYALNFGFDKG